MKRDRKNMLENLKSSGPGFVVPENYFNSLEDRWNVKPDSSGTAMTEDNEHEVKVRQLNTPNILDSIKKDHGFRVPEGYFEVRKPEEFEGKKVAVRPLISRNMRLLYISVAASILLFIGVRYMNTIDQSSETLVFQEDEIAKWIENDMVMFSSMEVAEAFSDVELEESLYPEEEVYSYLNDADIENLILDN